MRKKLFKHENVLGKDIVKNGPKVIYENEIVKKEIDRWIAYLEHNSFNELLYKIGFNMDDTVYLYETGKRYEFSYSLNNNEINSENTIMLSYGSMVDFGPEITVFDSVGSRHYDCVPHFSNYEGDDVILNSYEKKLDDTKSYRYGSFIYTSLIEFKSLEYKILIDVTRDIEDENRIVLNNQLELEEYLKAIEFPVSIIDLYNDLYRICGLDKYVKCGIKVVKNNNLNKEEITDMIKINNGVVDEFCITKDGKRIYLSNNGNWSYKMVDNDQLVKFSMEFIDNKINCVVSSNNDNEMNDYMDSLVKYDMSSAKCEVEDTKKLVRSMFPRK